MASKFVKQLAALPTQNVLAIGLALGAGYYFTIFNDGSIETKQLQTLSAQIKTAESQKIEADKAMKEVEQIRANVGSLSDQFKVISQQIPSEIPSFEIPTSIDTMAQKAGVLLKSTRPENPTTQEILEIIPTSVSLEGTFNQIIAFFSELGNVSRIMRLGNFSIRKIPNGDGKLSFEGAVLSYRFIGADVAAGVKK